MDDYTAKEIECIARLYSDYENTKACELKDYKIDFDMALKRLDTEAQSAVLEFIEDCRYGYLGSVKEGLVEIFNTMANYLNGG